MVRLALLLALAGCSSWINRRAASSTYRVVEKSHVAAARLSDPELARSALAGGIVQLEAFALAYPEQAGFGILRANAVCEYAVAFVFDDWEDAWLAGRGPEADDIGVRLHGLLDACRDGQRTRLPAGWSTGDAARWLPRMTRGQVEPVLWIATADAVEIAIDPIKNFQRLPEVQTALARCVELAPGSHDAAAEVLLGTLQAGRAAFFGGTDGAAYFAAARKLVGDGVLSVDVMFARGVAVARKDRALFTSTLERALAEDLSRWPEHRLGNELARKKARRYLKAADRLL